MKKPGGDGDDQDKLMRDGKVARDCEVLAAVKHTNNDDIQENARSVFVCGPYQGTHTLSSKPETAMQPNSLFSRQDPCNQLHT